MTNPDIILYTSKVEIAFQEAGADVTRYEIDLQNKPEWYASKVNPAGKIPALVYGSSKSDPEDPSPESEKIAESLVLLELVADLYPDSGLLPKDPVQRARARFFIDAISNKLPAPLIAFSSGSESPDKFIEALAEVQELLSPGGFAVGDHFTIADAAIAPFLGRWELLFRNDVGKYAEGAGKRLHGVLFQSERFARLQKYYANISSRQSFKSSFDSEYLLSTAKARNNRQNQ